MTKSQFRNLILLVSVHNKRMKILMVDDDADDQEMFSAAIKEANIDADLIFADDFDHLRSLLLDKSSPLLPDLIFLDLNMPKASGLDCLEWLRKHEAFTKVPVVIFTTSKKESDIQESYKKGANRFFKKPSSFSEWVDGLHGVFQLKPEELLAPCSIKTFVYR